MADTKVTAFPAASTLSGVDTLPVIQGGGQLAINAASLSILRVR